MIRSRLGLRAIGLCLALAGLMAVGAGVAQAEVGAYWLVSGKKISAELLPTLAGELENNHGTLLGEIGGVGIHILCTGGELIGAHLVEPNGSLLGKIRFTGCIVRQLKTLNVPSSLVTLGACAPVGGILETTDGKGLIRLHELKPSGIKHSIVVLEPKVGTRILDFKTTEECAFGELITVDGKLALKECKDAFLTDQVTHLVEEFLPLTELWLNGNLNNRAEIDGSANVTLSGEKHKGLTWAGHPA